MQENLPHALYFYQSFYGISKTLILGFFEWINILYVLIILEKDVK